MTKPESNTIAAKAGGNLGQSNSTAAQILGAIQGLAEIAGKIDEATTAALGAIATAQATAAGVIEAKKIAAIRAVESAKPKSSWLDELDRPPGWKPGDPK